MDNSPVSTPEDLHRRTGLALEVDRSQGRFADTDAHQPEDGCSGRSNEDLGQAAAQAPSDSTQKEAFDELFRRLWRKTVQWAHAAGATTQHPAEDAATQAWLKAWKYRQKFDLSKGSYGTWLGAIVRNETYDLLKLLHREVAMSPASDEPSLLDSIVPSEPELEALHFVFDAFQALSRDKPHFANVLSLKAQGYRDKHICEMLGMSTLGTVGSRLSRAKQYIASRLAERGVVFLPENAIGTVHPLGLLPLCRSVEGTFYSCSPLTGLFILPAGASRPPGSTAVCSGFFAKIWAYPLDDYQVSIQDGTSTEEAIFSWNQYVVHARGRSNALRGMPGEHDRRSIEGRYSSADPPRCERKGIHKPASDPRYGSFAAMLNQRPTG